MKRKNRMFDFLRKIQGIFSKMKIPTSAWIQQKIKEWLGITWLEYEYENCRDRLMYMENLYKNLVTIGIDVHFKSQSMIILFSKLQGGQIRHIDANFENLINLNNFAKELEERFNTRKTIWDAPLAMRELINDDLLFWRRGRRR